MLTVTALFTKNAGTPATGLTLAEIDLYLYRRTKADGTVATIWSGEHPSEEIGSGLYSKSYATDDLSLYTYYGSAAYTGATVLDSNYSLYGGGGEADKTGYALSATGLDSIAVTAPTGVATTFPGMMVQLFRRFFGKVTMTASALKTWDDTGLVVTTTQTVNDDGTTQTQGKAS